MPRFEMNEQQIDDFLQKQHTASLSLVDEDGVPYCVPVHFAQATGSFYIHSSSSGKKLDIIAKSKGMINSCLTVFDIEGYKYKSDDNPCRISTKFNSVIIIGKAEIVSDYDEKISALKAIVNKLAPDFSADKMLKAAIEAVTIIKINPIKVTTKAYM